MFTERTDRADSIRPRRLWFGFSASAAAWAALGFIDVIIIWKACTHYDEFGLPVAHPMARILYVIVSVALFATTVTAGLISYRNWRLLSRRSDFLDAEGVERREFMAILGVFVSVTLGMGIV